MDYKTINDKLLELNKDFYYDKIQNWALKEALKNKKHTEYSFSEPFICGIDDFKDDKRPLLMIVGQETGCWGFLNNFHENFEKSQQYSITLTHNNIFEDKKKWNNYNNNEEEVMTNYHYFWRFIRRLSTKYNICYNNLDKIHYTQSVMSTKCVKLWEDDEKYLNDNQLLRKEIAIVEPKYVIATVGEKYLLSLGLSLGIEINNKKLSSDNILIDIGDVNGVPIKLTEHPRTFFSKKYKNNREDVYSKVIEQISQLD